MVGDGDPGESRLPSTSSTVVSRSPSRSFGSIRGWRSGRVVRLPGPDPLRVPIFGKALTQCDVAMMGTMRTIFAEESTPPRSCWVWIAPTNPRSSACLRVTSRLLPTRMLCIPSYGTRTRRGFRSLFLCDPSFPFLLSSMQRPDRFRPSDPSPQSPVPVLVAPLRTPHLPSLHPPIRPQIPRLVPSRTSRRRRVRPPLPLAHRSDRGRIPLPAPFARGGGVHRARRKADPRRLEGKQEGSESHERKRKERKEKGKERRKRIWR